MVKMAKHIAYSQYNFLKSLLDGKILGQPGQLGHFSNF